MTIVDSYITLRYQNWLDYARHMSRVHHFEGWAEDLLNDVLTDLLSKPAEKIDAMIHAKTKKMINGVPTCELDKFVLAMMKTNAMSQVAPFRKNTLGKKVISRADGKITVQQSVEINGFDTIDEGYNWERNNAIDTMHARNIDRLQVNGFNTDAVRLYERHFIRGQPTGHFTTDEADAINRIEKFLTEVKKSLFDD